MNFFDLKRLYHLKKVIIVEGCAFISEKAYGTEGLLYYCDHYEEWFLFNNFADGGKPEDFHLRNQGYKYSWQLDWTPDEYFQNGELKFFYDLEREENV